MTSSQAHARANRDGRVARVILKLVTCWVAMSLCIDGGEDWKGFWKKLLEGVDEGFERF